MERRVESVDPSRQKLASLAPAPRSAQSRSQRSVSAHSVASEGKKRGRRQSRPMRSAAAQESLTKDEAHHLVEELRRRQNEDLLLVLEQEQRNETDREIEIAKVTDTSERRRLEQMFGVERARAS